MKEEWKDIPKYEDRYQASNIGNIRSLIDNHKNKRKFPKVLKQWNDKKGYKRIELKIDSKTHAKPVHRLIAETFIGIAPTEKHQINHKDGNKQNNHYSNLEWVTCKENIQHAHKNGLAFIRRGEDSNRAILTSKQVLEIRRLYKEGLRQCDLVRKYNSSKTAIRHIVMNKTWKHLGDING